MRRILLFSLIMLLTVTHLSWAEDLSPTFLPMVRGEWLITGEHSTKGKYSHQSCMSNEELEKYYSEHEILQLSRENQKDCQLVNNNKADRLRYDLMCKQAGLVMKVKHQFTKNSYGQYTLEKSISTEPNTPLMNYDERIIFKRIGPCSQAKN